MRQPLFCSCAEYSRGRLAIIRSAIRFLPHLRSIAIVPYVQAGELHNSDGQRSGLPLVKLGAGGSVVLFFFFEMLALRAKISNNIMMRYLAAAGRAPSGCATSAGYRVSPINLWYTSAESRS